MKNPPITVVHIITKLELGGAQKVCLMLCKDLPLFNVRTILISGAQGTLVNEAQSLNRTILLKSFKREISYKNFVQEIVNFFTLIKQLRNLKKEHRNIIVHTHSTKAGIIGRWAALFAAIKYRVHTVHGFAFHPHQTRIKWLMIYIAELITSCITTHLICVSRNDAHTGTQLLPCFKRKHTVIRAAVNQNLFYQSHTKPQFPTKKNHFIFGSISCFKEQKNIFDMLQAFAHVHTLNSLTRLEIIGDGHLRPHIESWITRHNLSHAITLHGWQYEVLTHLKKWHAFVLSSLWEGLPCAIIEARLLKIPVISYATGGITEVIFHQQNGLLYEQKDWRALAHGMLSLTRDKSAYTRLSSYPDNLTDFFKETMLEQHATLYKKLVNT